MTPFAGRLALQQRVLASYRASFFDFLAQACDRGLSVSAGKPMPDESIPIVESLQVAQFHPVQNIHLFSGSLLLCYQKGLKDWLGGWEPDILITEINLRTISTVGALKWMEKRTRPVIGWGLGSPSPASFPGLLKQSGERLMKSRLGKYLEQYHALLTYSRRGAEEYASLGFPADRIFIAPNAVTPPPAHSLPDRPEHLQTKPTVLFVGRLQARKRVDLLINACAALPLAIQPRLVIIGDGPDSSSLVALAKQVYPSAEFPGPRHGDDLVPFFMEADVFVLPGTGGLAVQEAMAYGLPIIMGTGDGTNDDLVRPANGWQLSDPGQLKEILIQALSDIHGLREKGAVSYNIVARDINLVTMREGFLRAINMVAACR